jgi:hypothetical protein
LTSDPIGQRSTGCVNFLGANNNSSLLLSTTMKNYILRCKQAAIAAGMTLTGIGVSGAITPANALTFNFSPTAGTSQLAIDGFRTAGNLWSSVLTDNATVNVNINFTALDAGTLGETSASNRTYNYDRVYSALTTDRTSANDNIAVQNLSTASTFNMLLNRTANNPYGVGSATPYLDNDGDANNRTINMTSANAKALGLLGNTNSADASISFSNSFAWDFDRNDGISSGAFDFIGIAAHEIGHALGFMSGVDILDGNSTSRFYNDNQFTYVSPLDLFRYSTESKNAKAIDWTADARDKYFSLDGGVTKIASFSTGVLFGDGRQDGHWKDNLGLGILDPTGAPGELLQISENDLQALDAIGWNRVAGGNALNLQASGNGNGSSGNLTVTNRADATTVPEPSDFIGTIVCAAVGVKMMLWRRQKLVKSVSIEQQ